MADGAGGAAGGGRGPLRLGVGPRVPARTTGASGGSARRCGRAPTMALTATATARVRADIARRLGPARPGRRWSGGFDRPEPDLRRAVGGGQGLGRPQAGRAARGARRRPAGARRSSTAARGGRPRRRRQLLTAAGHAAVAYHAGRADRAEAQEAFTSGRAQVVAATNAFGMGVNVPDVRLVVHTALPDSLEQLYQEAGRAGRDGEPRGTSSWPARPTRWPSGGASPARRIEPAEVDRLLARLAARADGEGRFAHGPGRGGRRDRRSARDRRAGRAPWRSRGAGGRPRGAAGRRRG